MPAEEQETSRRPVNARRLASIHRAAGWLANMGVSPNTVSVASLVFAIAAGALLFYTGQIEPGSFIERAALIAASAFVALRLLANLLDGLIAIEGGKKSPLGGVFNELPDRLSDALILIGFGYAAGGNPTLGFVAALVAITIAYIRELGHGLGARHHFLGPMAKQQRMALVIAAGIWIALTPAGWRPESHGLWLGIPAAVTIIIIALGIVTTCRRLQRIAHDLRRLDRGEDLA